MNSRNPWRISSLFSACYEFVLALFLLFQMLMALLVFEVAKFLPMGGQACSCNKHRHHKPFCSGHFPPFSPCRERDSGQPLVTRTTTRFARGFIPGRVLSEDHLMTSDGRELTSSREAGLANQARSSAYKRKGRHNGAATLDESSSEYKGFMDADACQCIAAGLDLYDDLIQVSSEYLKQKDRGHEEVILSLLKALQVQRKNLRTLYEELDEERVAAETAANEAMAMILRLQEEKSALQMEADHYQRMAEEKALHDEHAIQLLEEDLCRKENERILLEEELNDIRSRLYGVGDDNDDGMGVTEEGEKPQHYSLKTKPLLLLTGSDEASNQEEREDGNLVRSGEVTDLTCVTVAGGVSKEDFCEGLSTEDQPMKRLRGLSLHEMGNSNDLQPVSDETVERVFVEPSKDTDKCQPDVEDDAKAILVQLSAVEKQLLALEESEKLELWHQAQASQDFFICELLNPDKLSVAKPSSNDENDVDLPIHANDAWMAETDASTMFVEEKVVNVDVANVNDSPYCESQVPASEEIIEIHEGKHQRGRVVQWEASEEEKHLDLPSFVKKSNASPAIPSIIEGPFKPVVQSLPGMGEEDDWEAKRVVTLDGINLRLQALESESTLMWQRSVPPNHEHVNLVMLKEMMQELQELLKANRSVSAASETLTSMSAYVKGDGQHKKRHYFDGPGQFP